jgi:hypothetical protein
MFAVCTNATESTVTTAATTTPMMLLPLRPQLAQLDSLKTCRIFHYVRVCRRLLLPKVRSCSCSPLLRPADAVTLLQGQLPSQGCIGGNSLPPAKDGSDGLDYVMAANQPKPAAGPAAKEARRTALEATAAKSGAARGDRAGAAGTDVKTRFVGLPECDASSSSAGLPDSCAAG